MLRTRQVVIAAQVLTFGVAAESLWNFKERRLNNYIWGYLWAALLIISPVIGAYSAMTLRKAALLVATILNLCLLTVITPFMIWAE